MSALCQTVVYLNKLNWNFYFDLKYMYRTHAEINKTSICRELYKFA